MYVSAAFGVLTLLLVMPMCFFPVYNKPNGFNCRLYMSPCSLYWHWHQHVHVSRFESRFLDPCLGLACDWLVYYMDPTEFE